MLRTAVALIIYNRPKITARVFDAIASVQPERLFVIADGPRADRPQDAERCAETRKVVERVDWPCDVLTNFAPGNLGCRVRVSSGIDWVFSTVEEAIFLEDDCLPDPTFFLFCEDMLARYRDDTRVMHIGGSNFQGRPIGASSGYYFSRHVHVWGWASWRRAWRHYDVRMAEWPGVRAHHLKDVFDSPADQKLFTRLFDRVADGTLDTWDAQWTLACRLQSGLAVIPHTNLVSNIGFGTAATHTRDEEHPVANLATSPIAFPLRHPTLVLADRAADQRTTRVFRSSLYRRARTALYRLKHGENTVRSGNRGGARMANAVSRARSAAARIRSKG